MIKLKLVKCRSSLGLIILLTALAILSRDVFAAGEDSPRVRLLMDFGWRFHLGNNWGLCEQLDKAGQSSGPAKVNFNDSSWRALDLPHDWVVELPFDANANYDHGYKPVGPGFPDTSVGWYRRAFTLTEADRGKRLWLEFDGVYRDCRVFLNGFLLAHQESGYNGFRCDITDVANCDGKNILAVRVDASQFEGWFYEGAGIYRHVWLEKTSPLAIAPDGVFVYSSFRNNFPAGAATIHLQTQVLNLLTNAATATLTWQILDPDGKEMAKVSELAKINSGSDSEVGRLAKVSSPALWSPEAPNLYKLVTTVETAGKIVDRTETPFGIRTVAFDTTNGFSLNGKPYVIRGVCNHQDHAGVGSALPDALQDFRVKELKEMGGNAVRTSHNEPTAELLDACDRLGMLVMDENRLFGSDAQNLANLDQQIRRDRNHPSVFIWSLANEEHAIQRAAVGARVVASMQNVVHQLDPTRLCTVAMDGRSEEKADGFSSVIDVQGFNYIHRGDMDAFHKSNPTIPCIGTEEASAYYTRGIYQNSKTYKSAYDDNKPDYGTTAEEWWTYYHARPWASGSFVWTGFDYRGEASPFNWPNISSEFGILDTCGFPKDVFYYYQSWWTEKPVLHLMPHWNWPGREGQNIEVRCFSNCKQVELFLNGRSLGKKAVTQDSHLDWTLPYAPGVLSASGFDAEGRVTAQTKVETTGVPASVRLVPDHTTIAADGEDVSVFKVSVGDAQGRTVPVANNLIHFELSGPGKIIGVGNGDPACHEPDVYLVQNPVQSVGLNEGWRWNKVTKLNSQPRAEYATNFDDSSWEGTDVQSDAGQLGDREQAVFRVKFQASQRDLSAAGVSLNFELLDDDAYIFVNGQHVGDGHVEKMPAVFDVKLFLHPGENTIAVGVINKGGPGGIMNGVTLEYRFEPIPPHWQRSAFNGLAEIIVQTTKQSGEIKLTAAAEGLVPASKVITSTAGNYRACLP
jgi:beta-galactosidase